MAHQAVQTLFALFVRPHCARQIHDLISLVTIRLVSGELCAEKRSRPRCFWHYQLHIRSIDYTVLLLHMQLKLQHVCTSLQLQVTLPDVVCHAVCDIQSQPLVF